MANDKQERTKEINGGETLFLYNAASAVFAAFRRGHNPTFQQMETLEAALHACIAEKPCGHLKDDLCICYEDEADD